MHASGSAGPRVSPGAASCFAALHAAAAASATAGGAVRREPFEVECDSARRARLLVQLGRQLREGPPDREGTRGVNGDARVGSRACLNVCQSLVIDEGAHLDDLVHALLQRLGLVE